MPCTRPRRELRSPIMSPLFSCGVLISTSMIGSSIDGFTFSTALRKALRPAARNECSSESTVWYEPYERRLEVNHRVAGDCAALRGLDDSFFDCGAELLGNRADDNLVLVDDLFAAWQR